MGFSGSNVPLNQSIDTSDTHQCLWIVINPSIRFFSPKHTMFEFPWCWVTIKYPLVNIQKHQKTMERSTIFDKGRSTISMTIFNSELLHYQRVHTISWLWHRSGVFLNGGPWRTQNQWMSCTRLHPISGWNLHIVKVWGCQHPKNMDLITKKGLPSVQ